MMFQTGRVRFLASVRSVDEALLAVEGGADLIDCKDPDVGALGALPIETIAAIRKAVPAQIAVSAALGDNGLERDDLESLLSNIAEAGADYIKVSLEPGCKGWSALGRLSDLGVPRDKLVAVLAADDELALDLVAGAAAAGFAGVMLDTVRKESYSLPVLWPDESLRAFIAAARGKSLLAGLAGALRLRDIARLQALKPDILGFRGALCEGQKRSQSLTRGAVLRVRETMDAALALQSPGNRLANEENTLS